ncbi:hypothetical protein Tco_0420752 [Tanacetum coccineum]
MIKRSKCENKGIVPTEMELVLEYTQQGASHEVSDHLKMEMEMEIPSSSNVKLITECSDTTYTCYEVMKDLIKVSKLPQTLISYSSSQEKEEMHEENEVESVTNIFDDIDVAKVDLDFQKVSSSIDGDVQDQSPDAAPIDSDPFDLAPLINKTRGKDFEMKCSETPIFPPGFTPSSSHNQHDGIHDHNPIQSVGSESSHKVLGDLHKSVGFSLLERLEETIKVGLALGLNMEGCENTLAALIANNGEHMVDK